MNAPSRAWWPWAGPVVLACALATFTHADPDLWGHVRFGLDTLATRSLPSVDPYSFTQDRPWINHEWLSEVGMAAAYRSAGPAGLALLKALLAVSAFAIVWMSLRGVRMGIRLGAMAWLVLGAVHMFSTIRPQLWSFLFMAVLCRVLSRGSGRQAFWLAPMFALWANLHGGWIVGLGVLAVWELVDRPPGGEWRHRPPMLLAVCAAATLCTPYGWRLWQFLWQTVGFERSIKEWLPLWQSASVVEWVAWLGTSAAVLWIGRRPGPNRLARLLVLAFLAYAALRVMRMGSLYVVSALILLSPALRALAPARPARGMMRRSTWEPLALAMPLLVAFVAAVRLGATSLACVPSTGPWATDREAVTRLSAAPPGRLVTYFDWGEYAIWQLGPRIRVSMDGRRETVYSQSLLAQHDEVVRGSSAGLDALAAWAPDYVWLPQSSASTKGWLIGHGYQIVVETPGSFVASRVPLPVTAVRPALTASTTAARCFPN